MFQESSIGEQQKGAEPLFQHLDQESEELLVTDTDTQSLEEQMSSQQQELEEDAELEQDLTRDRSFFERTKRQALDDSKPESVPAPLQVYATQLKRYITETEERIRALEQLPKSREMKERLKDLYFTHGDNFRLIALLFREEDAAKRENLRVHFEAFLRSEQAHVMVDGDDPELLVEDERVRARTIQAMLMETGYEELQQPSRNTPVMTWDQITIGYLVDAGKKDLKNQYTEKERMVTLPEFLQSEGEESAVIEHCINRHKEDRTGFLFMTVSKQSFDYIEKEFSDAKTARQEAYRKLKDLRKRYQKQEEHEEELTEEERENWVSWGELSDAEEAFEEACSEYEKKQHVRSYYTDGQRLYIEGGSEVGQSMSALLNAWAAKAQTEFSGISDPEQKIRYRERSFRTLADIGEKMGHVGRMFSWIAYSYRLEPEEEAVFNDTFQASMERFRKLAETLKPGEGDSLATLLEKAERLTRGANETFQFLKAEKRRLAEGEPDDWSDEHLHEIAEERTRAKTDRELALKDLADAAAQEDAKRELEAEEKRVQDLKQQIQDRQDRIEANLRQYQDDLRRQAEADSHVLKIQLANQHATEQEVLIPKKVVGRLSDFTNIRGDKINGIGKFRAFSDRVFGIGASQLGDRIGKHVDRFLAGNGQITDKDLADTASLTAEATGLYSYADPQNKRLSLFKELSEAKDADEIKRICEAAGQEAEIGTRDPEELDLDDPFYEQYPNARKTVMMFRLVRGLGTRAKNMRKDDLSARLLAAEDNLRKLREQVLLSKPYADAMAAAAHRTYKDSLVGYQTDITAVQTRLTNIQSQISGMQPIERFKQSLEARNEAMRLRVREAFKSTTVEPTIEQYYEGALRFTMSQQQKEMGLSIVLSDLHDARTNDQRERAERIAAMRRDRTAPVERETLRSFDTILDDEIFYHEAFARDTGLLSFFRKNDDPEAGQLLHDYRQEVTELIKKQMLVDQPGGLKDIRELSELSEQEVKEYAARIRGRLLNLPAVYTKDRVEWFKNKRFATRVFQKLLSGDGADIGRLIHDVDALYTEQKQRDEIMAQRQIILLEGASFANQHVFVDLFEQKKSFGQDAVRSGSRLIRMMDADDNVAEICKACAVTKPLSYYEVIAEYLDAHPTEAGMELAKKQEIYTTYLQNTWLPHARDEMARNRPAQAARSGSALETAEQNLTQAKAHLAETEEALAALKAELAVAAEDFEERTKLNDIFAAETRARDLDYRKARISHEQVVAERDQVQQEIQRLGTVPANESEQQRGLREVDLAKARERLSDLDRRAAQLQSEAEILHGSLTDAQSGWNEEKPRLANAEKRKTDLEKAITEKTEERRQAVLRIESCSMERRVAKNADKKKALPAPDPAAVIAFLTDNVLQSKVPLKKERSNMLEYGVRDAGARLLEGPLGKQIDDLDRVSYNVALERAALHFFRCRRVTEQTIDGLPYIYFSQEQKAAMVKNFETLIPTVGTVGEYKNLMEYRVQEIETKYYETRTLVQRKDERLAAFKSKELIAYLPLVPLLLKDEKCLEHILTDNNDDYAKFIFELTQRTGVYMNFLSGTGIYNSLLDQYLLDFGPEILSVIHGAPVPDKTDVLRRFEKHYEAITQIAVTKTTLGKILDKARKDTEAEYKKRGKEIEKGKVQEEPGIPYLDSMTLCTMIMITGGAEGLRDEKRMALYRERAESNLETLREALPDFVKEYVPEEEKESFLTGVKLMEKTCILQDPDTYARTLLERLHTYRQYQEADWKATEELKGMQQEINLYLGSVRTQKEDGRKRLQEVRKTNAALKKKLEEGKAPDGPATPIREDLKEKVLEIAGFYEMLPAHGALTSFFQDMLARASYHASLPPAEASKKLEGGKNIMLNMLTMDAAITEYVDTLRQTEPTFGKSKETMFRSGMYELMSQFATSPVNSYQKKYFRTIMDKFLAEEKGAKERRRILIHDKGDYYGLGNTLSAAEETGFLGQANRESFEEAIRGKSGSAVKAYFDMGVEERTLVAQFIANDGVPVRKTETEAQKLYVEALKTAKMHSSTSARSGYLMSIVEGYVTGLDQVAPPDYRNVMSVMKRRLGLQMPLFEKAVRLTQAMQYMKEHETLVTRERLALLMEDGH